MMIVENLLLSDVVIVAVFVAAFGGLLVALGLVTILDARDQVHRAINEGLDAPPRPPLENVGPADPVTEQLFWHITDRLRSSRDT